MNWQRRHVPLGHDDLVEVIGLCAGERPETAGGEDVERLRVLVPHLVADVVQLRSELRREHERLQLELDRVRDLLERLLQRTVAGVDDEGRALLAEVEDALFGYRARTRSGF